MTGRTLSHYQILEQLGSGGMGEVYKARDKFNATVATSWRWSPLYARIPPAEMRLTDALQVAVQAAEGLRRGTQPESCIA